MQGPEPFPVYDRSYGQQPLLPQPTSCLPSEQVRRLDGVSLKSPGDKCSIPLTRHMHVQHGAPLLVAHLVNDAVPCVPCTQQHSTSQHTAAQQQNQCGACTALRGGAATTECAHKSTHG